MKFESDQKKMAFGAWPKEGINQKYHRSSFDVRFWTSQHAFSSFALLTPKEKFGMQG